MLKRYITVKSQYEGFHRWADAPDDIAFLRDMHRHMFKYEFTVDVSHNDRELEFFQVQRILDREIAYWFNQKKWEDLGSCEAQAEVIIGCFQQFYGFDRDCWCTVSEDGEHAGTVKYIRENSN